MKRIFIIAALATVISLPSFADGGNPKNPVITNPLGGGDTNTTEPEMSRSPIRRPSLFIEDHTLSFTNSCVGYTLELLQDDAVVYTYFIDSTDDLVLPSNLTGIYEIRLVGGSFTFVGEIEL